MNDLDLQTQVNRLIRKAAVNEEIPRFCDDCRSSRRTELEEDFPTHVVCSWLGNTEKAAREHYLKTLEIRFDNAAADRVCTRVCSSLQ